MSDKPKRKRSEVPPSSAANIEASPCFEPERFADTVYTLEGTALHLATEKEDMTGLDAEQAAAVQYCLDYIKQFVGEVHREMRLLIIPGSSGIADHIVVGDKHVECIDYKFGINSQGDPEGNRQVHSYVVGIFRQFPQSETVAVTLIYPRRDEIKRHTFTKEDGKRLELEIEGIATARRYAIESRLKYPSKACVYCAKAGNCSAFANAAMDVAKTVGDLEMTPFGITIPAIKDAHTAGKMKTLVDFMSKWVDKAKDQLLAVAMEAHITPEGYELAFRKAKRTVEDPAAAWQVLEDQESGVTQEEFLNSCSVSMTKLEESVAAHAPRGSKGKAKTEMGNLFASLGISKKKEDTPYLKKERKP